MSETSAKAQEKTSPSRGFKWRRYLAFLAIFTLLLYLLSLVVINTSWAKNKLTERLNKKSNSSWEVGSILWVPFGDVELNDLKTTMGEGGIQIKSLTVEPSWGDFFSGDIQLTGATAKEAEVDIDIKWLKENLASQSNVVEMVEPVQKPQPHVAPKPKPAQPRQNPNVKPQINPTQKPVPETVVAKKPELNDLPNHWLKVKKLNLTLRDGKEVLERITDLSASIPYTGKPADGELRFKFHDHEHVQKISWDGRGLTAEETNGELFNLLHRWKAVCRTSQPGMPFSFQFFVPQQKLNYTLDKPNLHLNVSSDNIQASFILNGSLRNLNTWRGILNSGSSMTTITENQKTHQSMKFKHTRLVGTISNGVFHIPAAEAIGHKASFLANGVIQKNLYSYGVVRLITNNEAKEYFSRVYHATRLIHIDHQSYHLLFPLDTTDRRYCDIYVDGKLTDLEIRHNRSDHWQSLNPALEKLWSFKNNELQEDGLLESSQ